jgi:ABC-type multidrug transport system fused ATPase/permease subunit
MASSGKSTLVDILYGIKSFSSGIIYFDGIDSKTLLPEQLRESIFFLRGLNLLPSTILENLTLGDKSISMNQINEALEKVELLTEIQKLKDGLLTQIDNQGSPLSLVQGLRLNIARAFLKPYRLILIDEALDSLDDISSQKISKQIFSETKWTTIISTHDNRIKQQCNKIITLDKRYRGAA